MKMMHCHDGWRRATREVDLCRARLHSLLKHAPRSYVVNAAATIFKKNDWTAAGGAVGSALSEPCASTCSNSGTSRNSNCMMIQAAAAQLLRSRLHGAPSRLRTSDSLCDPAPGHIPRVPWPGRALA